MNRLYSILLCVLVSVSYLPAQDDEERPAWAPKTSAKPGQKLDKKKAKEALKSFGASFKNAKDPKERIAALGSLEKAGCNDIFAKPVGKILLRDKDLHVRIAAAQFLGQLGHKSSKSVLVKVILDRKNRDEMELLMAAGKSLGLCGKKSNFKKLENDFVRGSSHVKRALVLSWGFSKDWHAIELLGQWIERPAPANPSSASNPPASYWQQRYREWRQIRKQVEWSLWSITGKVFYSKKEVKAFLKKNPKPPKKSKKRKKS